MSFCVILGPLCRARELRGLAQIFAFSIHVNSAWFAMQMESVVVSVEVRANDEELRIAAVGAGRIHECLRGKREELTSRCAEEEAKLEGIQARAPWTQPVCDVFQMSERPVCSRL